LFKADRIANVTIKKNEKTHRRGGRQRLRLAGQRHPETGVVFDQRGSPIFDNDTAYDTRFTGSEFGQASYQTQMRMASRDLRTTIGTNSQLRSQFNSTQLQAIQSGNTEFTGYTWHHHQDSGRMQLVDKTVQGRTGHIGGEAMSSGQYRWNVSD
jgi:hypothetical protein